MYKSISLDIEITDEKYENIPVFSITIYQGGFKITDGKLNISKEKGLLFVYTDKAISREMMDICVRQIVYRFGLEKGELAKSIEGIKLERFGYVDGNDYLKYNIEVQYSIPLMIKAISKDNSRATHIFNIASNIISDFDDIVFVHTFKKDNVSKEKHYYIENISMDEAKLIKRYVEFMLESPVSIVSSKTIEHHVDHTILSFKLARRKDI